MYEEETVKCNYCAGRGYLVDGYKNMHRVCPCCRGYGQWQQPLYHSWERPNGGQHENM